MIFYCQELEKEELLLQYKQLTKKADELESNLLQNTDDAANTQQELLHRQQERVMVIRTRPRVLMKPAPSVSQSVRLQLKFSYFLSLVFSDFLHQVSLS